jgi:hypothetical protein
MPCYVGTGIFAISALDEGFLLQLLKPVSELEVYQLNS